MKTLIPKADRIIVRPQEAAEMSPGGIILTDSAKEKPKQGTVIAVGPGKWENGVRTPMDVEVGDVVAYGKYSGTEIEDLLLLRADEVLATIVEEG